MANGTNKKATQEVAFLFAVLGRQDSNLRMSAPKADALPLGDAPLLAVSINYDRLLIYAQLQKIKTACCLNREPAHTIQARFSLPLYAI